MSKEKLPPEEGKEEANKGFIEISLPNLSGIKDKVDEGLERIEDAVDNSGRKYMTRDIQAMLEEGRVLLNPSLPLHGYGVIVCVAVMWVICMIARSPLEGYALCGVLLLPAVAFILLGKYEIRYDDSGFSTCIGKKELHRYAWSDVTDVADKKKVYVNGKRLFADPSMRGFDRFYHLARRQVKGGGKTVPSEKKRRNRQKPPTQKAK